MAEGVIDGLEVVEIDEDQGQGLLGSLLQGLLEPLLQQAAVGQAGEGVIEGEAAHHLLPGRTFGDIPGHPKMASGLVLALPCKVVTVSMATR